MIDKKDDFDWVGAALDLFASSAYRIKDLAIAAGLNAEEGDVATIDLSGINLENQDLAGWDLRFANFEQAILKGADLRNTSIDVDKLIRATEWQSAKLDASTRSAATLRIPISELEFSVRTSNCLSSRGISTVGELIQKQEYELLQIEIFGRRSLNEVKEVLAQMGLHLGMEPNL